ncbi:MAG: heat-inducible transcriptional repressor HrcA [Armatimonadota bacterium]
MELDRRKESILRAIVVNYVQRAEPVGSHFLASQEHLGVRSATIRNELAEMTDLGYLRQPHTSAGRIPSDRGYRYYVDHLMSWERLSSPDARALRGAQKVSEGDLEQLLLQTCRVLSSLTRYTAMATPPTGAEPVIRQVHLVQASPKRLLAVVVLDNGQVVHRFCEMGQALSPGQVDQLSNMLGELLRDVEASGAGAVSLPEELTPYHEELRLILAAIHRGIEGEEGDLYLDGASHILEQPEFRDSNKVEPLVRLLEARRSAFETLRRLLREQQNVTVSIGQENPHEAMQEVSLVTARYVAGPRMYGWVGVLGPTRMHYEQSVSAVQYAARVLSETLERLSLDEAP